jgi:hypothetical protein
MVKRRSMGTALSLNPDKLAFIHGEQAMLQAGNVPEKIPAADRPSDRPEAALWEPGSASPRIKRRGHRPKVSPPAPLAPPGIVGPSYSGDLPPLLVSLTTRLSPATAEALRRAALEQRLQRRRPHTQQEIVEAAVRQWLAANGFGRPA